MPPAKSRKRNGYGMNTVLQCDVACGLAHDKGFTPEKAQPDSVPEKTILDGVSRCVTGVGVF